MVGSGGAWVSGGIARDAIHVHLPLAMLSHVTVIQRFARPLRRWGLRPWLERSCLLARLLCRPCVGRAVESCCEKNEVGVIDMQTEASVQVRRLPVC